MEKNSNSEKKREILLRKIKEEVIGLKDSPLYKGRITNGVFPVIGEGSHYSKIMFIGEAPGRNEALKGRPFCGRAGAILDDLLESIEMDRKNVYITNIVKDRPPNNRDPYPEEIQIYAPFLDRQIKIIRPAIIAALGRFSSQYILKKLGFEKDIEPISIMHGKVFTVNSEYGPVKAIPLLHPAAAIYDERKKEILLEDFKILKKEIDNL